MSALIASAADTVSVSGKKRPRRALSEPIRYLSEGDERRKPKRAPPATRANGPLLDLVYPFDFNAGGGGSGGGGGGGGGGQQIAVDPDGPLELTGDLLTLNTKTPIYVSDRAVSLLIDDDTLATKQVNGALMVKTAAPLNSGTGGGVTLGFDPHTMALDSVTGVLKVLVDSQGPLQADTGGITLQFNTQDFVVNNGTLALASSVGPTYLSPFATYEVTPVLGISQRNGNVKSKGLQNWSIGYYIYMVSSAGIVNGLITLELAQELTGASGENSLTSGLNFTFVLSPMYPIETEVNLSLIVPPTVSPTNQNRVFVPNSNQSDVGYLGLPPQTKDNWYVPIDSPGLRLVSFMPTATGNEKFGQGTLGYCAATIQNTPSGTTPSDALAFTVSLPQTSGSNWFDQYAPDTVVTTGPIPFSYQGYVYSPNGNNHAPSP
ncbi:fiber-1 [Fowl aviadenovirus C]|uniref:Fiber-1 n=1 Tax=Fowl aviadenovirus C TaxID=190063 RepID=F2VJI4_9ADEN|nr:fiber-1 [Fowl aviadenovirus C]ADQ39071.1 fiber-1 [Fowl aviadenovirus C]